MSRRQQRDLFSHSLDTQNHSPQQQGSTGETALHSAPKRDQAKRQRGKKSAEVHFERVHLNVEDVAAWYSVSVPTIWRLRRTNPDFPQGHLLTTGSRRWFRSDLEAYDRTLREQNS